MRFHNPYHFVPVEGKPQATDLSVTDFEAGRGQHVTHDRYERETISGRILCRLHTESSLVIGGRREELDDRSHRVEPFMIDGEPAIPASTLRGMISTIAEAASDSALRVLHDQRFSRRRKMNEALSAIGMIRKHGECYKLLPLALPVLRRGHDATFCIPQDYQRCFQYPSLKVYLNGYTNEHPKAKMSGSFLATHDPDSYCADSQQFWYMKLSNSRLQNESIVVQSPRKSRCGNLLLGQTAEGEPISEAEYEQLDPTERKKYTRGILRVLGIDGREEEIPKEKVYELFLPYPKGLEQKNRLLDATNAVEHFHRLAEERTRINEEHPFELKGSKRSPNFPHTKEIELRDGDLVFFELKNGRVHRVAISSIWREALPSCHDFFKKISPEILPFHEDRERITIAEQLFGFVEQQRKDKKASRALKGRLRFSFGRVGGEAADLFQDEVLLKILDRPKPPSPSLYFVRYAPLAAKEAPIPEEELDLVSGGVASGSSQAKEAFIPKEELDPLHDRPQGRKFYLHHRNANGGAPPPWKSSHEQERLQQKSRVRPIRKGVDFYFHIDFENLTPDELSLLCYALRPTDAFRHKLGMGKGIGLGTVRIDPVAIFSLDRRKRYACDALFGGSRYHSCWVRQGERVDRWPERYQREREEARDLPSPPQGKDFESLRHDWRQKISRTIRTALETIGDPSATEHAVHTPQVAGADIERENFKWFVKNEKEGDNGKGQMLKPITQEGTIPPLKR